MLPSYLSNISKVIASSTTGRRVQPALSAFLGMLKSLLAYTPASPRSRPPQLVSCPHIQCSGSIRRDAHGSGASVMGQTTQHGGNQLNRCTDFVPGLVLGSLTGGRAQEGLPRISPVYSRTSAGKYRRISHQPAWFFLV